MITLESDLRISFDQIGIKFQSIINDHRKELEEIIKNAVSNFDFKAALEWHIQKKIKSGLEDAFSEISLKENMKIKIWDEIEKRLEKI